MQIVIDIPKDVIEDAKSNPNYYPTYLFEMIWIAIVNGTPLPKGHGRLIDADAMKKLWKGYQDGLNANKWISVTYRELDEDERQMYPDAEFVYDCKLPEDAQDVLITAKYRQVEKTTFYRDAENGCWFDSYEDKDDVLAWMPLPEPYKAESEGE